MAGIDLNNFAKQITLKEGKTKSISIDQKGGDRNGKDAYGRQNAPEDAP